MLDWLIVGLREKFLSRTGQLGGWAALLLALFALNGCVGPVRRTTRVPAAAVPAPALEATLPDLLARLDNQSEKIQTLTATVDLQPTAGSVYSGVIKEYHDVRGFILLKKPAMIRILGQAPVVRTDIFDMVSDGKEFRLYIPSKQKFIVGKTELKRTAKNALENMRPQHILDALSIPPIDPSQDKIAFEQDEADGQRYYVISVLKAVGDNEFSPERKIWFDRSDLQVSRVQIFGPGGVYLEDVHYTGYKDFGGVIYPSEIRLHRPIEDYRLAITVEKAVFNQNLPPDKFDLKKPQNAQLVELSDAAGPENSHGK